MNQQLGKEILELMSKHVHKAQSEQYDYFRFEVGVDEQIRLGWRVTIPINTEKSIVYDRSPNRSFFRKNKGTVLKIIDSNTIQEIHRNSRGAEERVFWNTVDEIIREGINKRIKKEETEWVESREDGIQMVSNLLKGWCKR